MSADALGRRTRDFFDSKGNTTQAVAADDSTQQYSYNAFAEVTQYTDQDSNGTSYTYNAANELVGTTNPMGYATTYSYNSAGEMTGSTDADGHNITYGYDKAGRLTSEAWVGGNYTASFSYNALGEVKTASDPFSSYSFGYDGFGDLASQSNAGTPGAPTVTLSYTYDGFFNRSGMSENLGGTIQQGPTRLPGPRPAAPLPRRRQTLAPLGRRSPLARPGARRQCVQPAIVPQPGQEVHSRQARRLGLDQRLHHTAQGEALAASVRRAVGSCRGQIEWEFSTKGQTWILAPARVREQAKLHRGRSDLDAADPLQRTEPDFGKRAHADRPLLGEHLRRHLTVEERLQP